MWSREWLRNNTCALVSGWVKMGWSFRVDGKDGLFLKTTLGKGKVDVSYQLGKYNPFSGSVIGRFNLVAHWGLAKD